MAYPPPRQVRYKAARLHAQFVDGSCRRDVKRSVILVAPGEIRWLFRNHVFRASLFECVLLCFDLLLCISFCYFCEVHSQSDGASAQGTKKENKDAALPTGTVAGPAGKLSVEFTGSLLLQATASDR